MIQCDLSSHEVGHGFPKQAVWAYCCDCATFWPYDRIKRGSQLADCPVCERQIAKRYLCNSCQLISVESTALVRRKAHFIDSSGVKPDCPACGCVANGASLEHDCADVGISFLTARFTCLFCDVQIAANDAERAEEIAGVLCSGCGAELMASYKFCKRCGKARAELSPEIGQLDNDIDDTDDAILDLPTSFTADDDEEDEEPTAEPPEPAEESPYLGYLHDSSSYAPAKRRTPWIVGGAAVLLSLMILIVIALVNSKPNAVRNPPSTPEPQASAPPGMVYIKGGEFMMGNDSGDEYERPAHKVKVAPFYIDIHEVTCEDYLKFINATGHRPPANWVKGTYSTGASKQPVTGIDWNDAKAYADWAKKRLPTEEEWEFAARGGLGATYPWGNEWRSNFANAGDSSAQRLVDVASNANGKTSAGVMDMIGNAWEWTASDVVVYPGGHLSAPIPKNVKVIRGGSWQETNKQATTTYRGFLRTSDAEDYSATGFRCVKDPEPVSSSQQ